MSSKRMLLNLDLPMTKSPSLMLRQHVWVVSSQITTHIILFLNMNDFMSLSQLFCDGLTLFLMTLYETKWDHYLLSQPMSESRN